MSEPTPDRDHAVHLYRQMLRIRRFEERCGELYQEEKIRGFLHLYIGQEAIASGVMDALRPTDRVFATYREHGHALARGIPAQRVMAEMYGKQEGCSHGRGGSMHLFCTESNFYGGTAIVAGHLPMAVGSALATSMRGEDDVTACFFGEGAVAEGEFHEAMNLAALWKLPVLFCCENNGYAMGTALDRSEAQTALTVKANSYEVPAESVDGMDVLAVNRAARAAVAAVGGGIGPFFLEFRTYRFRAHSMFDPQLYRSKEEVEQWKERDPLPAFEKVLRDRGWVDDAALETIEDEVTREIADAEAFAEAGTWEPVEHLTEDVYSPGGAS